MAFARISQTFADGVVFEVLIDSDLDTTSEVALDALSLWRATFAVEEADE